MGYMYFHFLNWDHGTVPGTNWINLNYELNSGFAEASKWEGFSKLLFPFNVKESITGIRYVFYFDQEAQLELERLIKENAEMEERLQKLEGCQDLVTKDETDQIKKLHQVPY